MVAVICVSVLKVKHGADGHGLRSFDPTRTSVAPVKFVPVRITGLLPSVDPDGGLRLVRVGTGVTYVYGMVFDIPPGVVTLTLTWPAAFAGTLSTVIEVSLLNVKHGVDGQGLRSFDPKFTSVAPVKFVPVRVTLLPPNVEPEVGLSVVNVGAGGSTVRTSADDVEDVPPGVFTSVSYVPPGIELGRLIVRSVSSLKSKQSG
jgi:hypothetical protein